ncbi:MAG: alanine racemase [Lentisphaeria bacterium]
MIAQSELVIDVGKLVENWRFFIRFQENCRMVPVLKSDSYGHGLAKAGRALEKAGAEYLAVFTIAEAEILRQAGIKTTLWVLEGILPADLPAATRLQVTSACWSFEQARALAECARQHSCRCKIHLKIDTGMSRLGFLPSEVPDVLHFLQSWPELELTGCFSHLAVSAEAKHPLTLQQVREFRQVISLLPKSCRELHLCATNGILNRLAPELPFARLGIGLYGYSNEQEFSTQLQPAMTFRSRVLSVKELPSGSLVSYHALYQLPQAGRLAVVPVGYADGYPRTLSNKAEVLIRGQRLPVRGRICMGMLIIETSSLPDLQPGEEVVLLGQQGNECISAAELAAKAGTIAHEILCNLGKHPNRIIRD